MRQKEISNSVGILVSVVMGLIGVYGQTKNPLTQIWMFSILLGLIGGYFLAAYFVERVKEKIKNIKENSERIGGVEKSLNSIKEKLAFRKEIDALQVQVTTLKNMLLLKGKKGFVVDPRWVFIILIIIVGLLYIKAKWFT